MVTQISFGKASRGVAVAVMVVMVEGEVELGRWQCDGTSTVSSSIMKNIGVLT